jgi:hypothetical protein
MSNDAAGFAPATDRSVASPNRAFDAGLQPGPFPDQAASLLPGLLTVTRTGLTPAGDDKLQTKTRPLDDHLLITGRTGWSTRPRMVHTVVGLSAVPYARGNSRFGLIWRLPAHRYCISEAAAHYTASSLRLHPGLRQNWAATG